MLLLYVHTTCSLTFVSNANKIIKSTRLNILSRKLICFASLISKSSNQMGLQLERKKGEKKTLKLTTHYFSVWLIRFSGIGVSPPTSYNSIYLLSSCLCNPLSLWFYEKIVAKKNKNLPLVCCLFTWDNQFQIENNATWHSCEIVRSF